MDERLKAEFIRLIGCSVTDKKFDFGDFDDFNGLAGLISGQNVFSLVRDKIEDSGAPANFKDYVNRKHLSAVNQQIQQDYYCEVIFGNLEKLGVEYLPFKGGAVRKYYPRPEMRTSCDVDFLVRESDLPKVRETLSSLGFEKQAEANDQSCHDGWEINKTVHVEPHIRLFNETYEGFGDDVWETAVKTSALGRAFSAEKNFVYVALHSFKHFSHGGGGVKSVLDLLILSRAVDPKSPYIADSLKKFGIGKFVGKMLDVARLWTEGAGADDRETVVISDYILDGGAYGSSAASAILG
ncbi:MAG TPA: hypothetical protein DDW54_03915, partial [Clostridiales bacterium]|nr:hypothetical protein [Clostridiales bacterium]